MPQASGTSSFTDALGTLFGAGGGGYRNQRERRQDEKDWYEIRRNKDRDAFERQKQEQLEADRAADNQRQMEGLALQQEREKRMMEAAQAQAAQEAAQTEKAARQLDIQEFNAANPDTAPLVPEPPGEPKYLKDPIENYDQPAEIDALNQTLQGSLGGYVMNQGVPVGPTAVPQATIESVRGRALDYIRAGVDPVSAITRARSDILGASPRYTAPKEAYEPGMIASLFYDPEPAQPARIDPTEGLTAPAPVDVSQGPAAVNARNRAAYEAKLAAFEKARAAREAWRPPVYPGYPWRNPGQAPAAPAVPVAPAPPAAGPPALQQSPVRRTRSGITFTVQ